MFMSPVKEPHYFSGDVGFWLKKRGVYPIFDNFEKYKMLFKNVKNERAIGEASTPYLYSKVAAKEIYKFNPNAKIIIILRNPVHRAFSHWVMNYTFFRERDLFSEKIKKKSKNKFWRINPIIDCGLYYNQIKRYMDVFPRKNVLILYFYDLKKNPERVMRKIFKFLGVRQVKIKDIDKKYNQASTWRYRFVGKILMFLLSGQLLQILVKLIPKRGKEFLQNCLLILKSKNLPKMTDEEKKYLEKVYSKEIPKLNKLLGKANVEKLMSLEG